MQAGKLEPEVAFLNASLVCFLTEKTLINPACCFLSIYLFLWVSLPGCALVNFILMLHILIAVTDTRCFPFSGSST
jgi:hypothetical protein